MVVEEQRLMGWLATFYRQSTFRAKISKFQRVGGQSSSARARVPAEPQLEVADGFNQPSLERLKCSCHDCILPDIVKEGFLNL
jgi:hypothetical protein